MIPNEPQNLLKNFDVKADPLSEPKVAGIPYLQHTQLKNPFAKDTLVTSAAVHAVTWRVA